MATGNNYVSPLPLESRFIELDVNHAKNGSLKPALDKFWVESEQQFPKYYPLRKLDVTNKQTWLEEMDEVLAACYWLLQLPYHKFWSQFVYGPKSAIEMLQSYLLCCPRYTDDVAFKTMFTNVSAKRISETQNTLHKLILLIIVRIATAKETEANFMTPSFHAKLIRDNHFIDVVSLMDICALYGRENKQLLSKMIKKLTENQPKLSEDLKIVGKAIIERLDVVELRLKTLLRNKNASSFVESQQALEFQDVILYLLDISFTLLEFCNCCPLAKRKFYEVDLMTKLPSFFDVTLTPLQKEIQNFGRGGFEQIPYVENMGKLRYISDCWIVLFRRLLEYNCLNLLLKDGERPEVAVSDNDLIGLFIDVMTNSVIDHNFILLYEKKFPFSDDCVKLIDKGIEIDSDQLSYIGNAISSVVNQNAVSKSAAKLDDYIRVAKSESYHPSPSNEYDLRPMMPSVEDIKTKVKHVQDVLPHIEASIAEKHLKQFNYDTEAVIDFILNESTKEAAVEVNGEPMAENVNEIVNEEDFEPNLRRLSIGKKRGGDKVLENHDVVNMKSFYDQFQFETANSDEDELTTGVEVANPNRNRSNQNISWQSRQSMSSDGDNLEYDDEYDDTYDSQNVGVQDADSADEVVVTLQNRHKTSNIQTSGDYGSGKAAAKQVGDHSRSNQKQPIDRRVERGKQEQTVYAHRKAESNISHPKDLPPRDAVTSETETDNIKANNKDDSKRTQTTNYTGGKDRAYKDRNRARVAHHNRKNLAAKKFSKGF